MFSRPFRAPRELQYLDEVLASGHVHGDGAYTARASRLLSGWLGDRPVLLTSSGTHALEMCSLLLDIGPGDEVVIPSFTFSSAATAITQFGGIPVFVDSEPLTGNVDPERLAEAIGPRTKAISIVHYGGVAVDMSAVNDVASRYGLPVIEDNAHGFGAKLNGASTGTLGTLAIQSFHDTKNIHSGEGGAIVINDSRFLSRAEILREKGTDRAKFLRGQVDKYTWTDKGSSYLMSELSAAVLLAQLEHADKIQLLRETVWLSYRDSLQEWASSVGARLMTIPDGRTQPSHLFAVHMPSRQAQQELLDWTRRNGVHCTFHYVPLDSSPAGERYGRRHQECQVAADFASRLVRLPLWAGMGHEQVARVVDVVRRFRPGA